MARAYVAFAQEFPVYFSVLARCELRAPENPNPHSNQGECARKADALQLLMVGALERGMRDGSIRADAGPPAATAIVWWGVLHGVIQLAASKANLLAHHGVGIKQALDQALLMARRCVAAAT